MDSFYQKTTLDNGITVLSERMPNVRSVALGIWVGVGSRDEPQDINGMSHFLEHLMFKGTDSRSSREISESFESMGAELNAFTAKEVTAYYTRLLDEHLPVGLEILADMLQNSVFKDEDIKAEKQVVLEEISLHEDSPDEIIHDLFSDSLYDNHPLGKRILGNHDTVKAFNRDKTVTYFNEAYSSKNTVIASAGSIDHDKLVQLVQRFFIAEKTANFKRKEKAVSSSSKLLVMKKDTEQAHICLGTLALKATHKDRFVLSVLDNVLGGGMSSRLFWEIREKRGLAYSVYTYHSVHTETGLICLYAGTNPKNVNEVLKIMLEQAQKISDEPVSENELYRAKQHIKGQLVLGLESTSHRMMRLGKSELSQGKIYSIDQLIKKIDAVTAKDVQSLAKKLFAKERLNLAVIGPFNQESFAGYNFSDQAFL